MLKELFLSPSRARATPPYHLAEISTYQGDKEAAFRDLEKALQGRYGFMAWAKVDPSLDPLRSDPRFHLMMRRMGLAP
jgi:hypothetical protein